MKILLSYLSDSNDTRESSTGIIPGGMLPLAAHLSSEKHETVLANFSHVGYKKAVKQIEHIAPDVAAFSLMTHNRNDTLKLIKELKKVCPKTITVAGGIHATALAEDIAHRHPEIDHIISGEGESGFDILTRGRGNLRKRIICGKTNYDASSIPSGIDFNGEMIGINPNEQYKYIMPTRGLESRAAFSYSFYDRVIFRPVSAVVDEMQKIHEKYGIIFFSIRDESFAQNREKILEFCRELRARAFYPMWNCQMLPSSVDGDLVAEMKKSGCERIFLSAESGSDNILTILQTKESVTQIESACSAIRRAGLYLTLLLRAGLVEEKRSDIQKSIALIKKTLPGETIILPAVYYPGSLFYEKAVLSQRIDGSAMFERKDKSLYLRSDIEMRSWIEQIRVMGSQIRRKSWYNEKNFHEHRKHTGECWVTDLLEGDYHLDEEKERSAEQCYLSLISKYPLNIWGYLRMGKLSFRGARFGAAEMHFTKVTELLPQYYGGWLKLAESRIAQGKKREGKESIQRAFALNQWDLRITSLVKGL